MKINYKGFLILLFLAGVGICAGSFFEVGLNESTKSALSSVLATLFQAGTDTLPKLSDDPGCCTAAIKSVLLTCIIGFFSGALVFLLPLLPAYVLLKGISIGFSSAMLLEAFGAKGILYIAATLMPQNLIQLPVYCLLGTISFQFAGSLLRFAFPYCASLLRGRGRSSSVLRTAAQSLFLNFRLYIAVYLCALLLLCISCAIQAYLLPTVF